MSPRYFVILGSMRTGSNLCEEMIAGLGDTVCHGEAFNPAFAGGPNKSPLRGWTLGERDRHPLAYLEAMIGATPHAIAGFRLFNGHDARVLAHVATDPDCARIVLRRDPLDAFVSLCIARETDQWLLRNPARRKTVRVVFDPDAYETYRAGIEGHHARLDTQMATAGLDALRLDYRDLTDPATAGRLARHIGSRGQPAGSVGLVRQNPGHLRDKVANYEEMCAHLGLVPETGQAPEPDRLLLARASRLALVPLHGPAHLPALALMHRIDARMTGEAPLGRSALVARAGTLFDAGTDATGRHVFAMTAHPGRRLLWSLERALFGDDAGRSPVRAHLSGRIGSLAASADALGREGWLAAVNGLLDLLDNPGPGKGPLIDAEWQPQSDLVAPWNCGGRSVEILRLDDFPAAAARLGAIAGIDPIPPGQVNSLLATGPRGAGSLPPLDEGTAVRLAQIHAGDYQSFGYTPLPAG